MSGEDGWVLLPAGSRLDGWLHSSRTNKMESATVEVIAWAPERDVAVDNHGNLVRFSELSDGRKRSALMLGGTPVQAGPGWWKGEALLVVNDAREETVEVEWHPVLLWMVGDSGRGTYGVYTDNEGWVTDHDRDEFYWHESEGQERRSRLADQLVEEKKDEIARARRAKATPPPPVAPPMPPPPLPPDLAAG